MIEHGEEPELLEIASVFGVGLTLLGLVVWAWFF